MRYLEVAPRLWIPDDGRDRFIHSADDDTELRRVILLQSLFDSFRSFRESFLSYYSVHHDKEDPTIPDYYPKFQYYVLKAFQELGDLGNAEDFFYTSFHRSHADTFKRLAALDLDSAARDVDSGRIDIESRIASSLGTMLGKVTGISRLTMKEHVAGNCAFFKSVNNSVYSDLASLDALCDTDFFSSSAASEKYLTLIRYMSSLGKKVSNRSEGITNKNPVKTMSRNIPKKDSLILDDISCRIASSFPLEYGSKDNPYGGSSPSVSSGGNSSCDDNKVRVPLYCGSTDRLLDDFHMSRSLFYYALKSRGIKDDDFQAAYEQAINGDFSGRSGLENRLADMLAGFERCLPVAALKFYNADHIYQQELLKAIVTKGTDNPDDSLKSVRQTLDDRYGIDGQIKQFAENLLSVDHLIKGDEEMRQQQYMRLFREYGKVVDYFTRSDVMSFVRRYNLDIGEKQMRSYFPSTMEININ